MSTLAALLLAFALVACGESEASGEAPTTAPENSAPAAKPGVTDPAGLKAAMDAGPVTLIDVRTPGEYAGGHVPGAVNIPLDQLQGRLSELESKKSETVYLICAVGGRSARATNMLASAGFSTAVNVDGGTNGWKAAGYPVE